MVRLSIGYNLLFLKILKPPARPYKELAKISCRET